jgi:1-acyl-sn-glycerol-3-phosphate acyltransferase
MEGGIILCANHRSYHDTLVMALACPRDLHFMAKAEIFKGKFFTGLFTRLGAIPVNRANPDMNTLKRAVKILKDGKALALFMQGGRRAEFDASEYKAGVALFAINGKALVVPVNIKSKFRLFSKVQINIGKPISFEEYWGKKLRTEELSVAAQKVMDEIVRLGTEHED